MGGDLAAAADPTVGARVDAVLSLVEQGRVPGVALAAARDGKVFVRTSAGAMPDGGQCPADLVFPTMSFGKAITASAIARVQALGAFDWDDPVEKYIPDYAQRGKETTTMRHLLTHAAGIPMAGDGIRIPRPDDWTDVLTACYQAEAEWAPGSRTAYHGISAIVVAAEVARRATGKTWEELYYDVAGPIGSNATMDIPAPAEGVIRAHSPEWLDRLKYHPAGGYFVQVDDVLAVLQLHLDKGRYGDTVVVPEPAWQQMHRPQYREDIEAARHDGRPPVHEWWAVGWLLRGELQPGWPTAAIAHWFGLPPAPSPAAFAHAGTSTVLGIADPTTGVAVAVASTAELDEAAAVQLRAAAAALLTVG